MQSLSTPLSQLHGDAQWFCRDHQVKLLWIHCAESLRKTILTLLPGYEYHHDNRSAWLVTEDAFQINREGWEARATRWAKNWEDRRLALAKEGGTLPPLGKPSEEAANPQQVFHQLARRVCASLAPPYEGYVVVLAPTVIDHFGVFEEHVTALIGDPALHGLRLVVVTTLAQPLPTHLLDHLGQRGLLSVCDIDAHVQQHDLAAMFDPKRKEGTGIGAAPRGVTPPWRKGTPEPLAPEDQARLYQELGINPAYASAAPQIRADILGAAMAMKAAKWHDALRLQSQARDCCAALGEPLLQVFCQLGLASYQSGLGMRVEAIAEIQAAVDLATQHSLWVVLCQAHLALGLIHAQSGQLVPAITAYVAAAHAAERGEAALLHIESWRIAGQLLSQNHQARDAMQCFQRAIAASEGLSADSLQHSSASEAARQLARMYQEHHHQAQADALFAQADRLEVGDSSQPIEVTC